MSLGSMPAWAIASLAAFTISDSLVSPSSLPNLPWDQPTMQAVMGTLLLPRAYTLNPEGPASKPSEQENSSLQPYFRPPEGVDCAVNRETDFQPWPTRRRCRLNNARPRAGP